MAVILKGAAVSNSMIEEMSEKTAELKDKGINPTLAILRVGNKDSDISYERGAMKRCEQVGVSVENVVLPEDVQPKLFFETLERLNNDRKINGILMLRPLPGQLDNEKARKMLNPGKDVDGCTDGSLSSVFTNTEIGFAPCTAEAAVKILEYYGIEISGKKIAVIGRSLVVGRPVAMMLMHKGATPVICHTKTKDIPAITKQADIIIAASGQMESVGTEYVSAGQVIIDVGISWNEEKQKLCGDVKYDEVEPIVKAITPVPGGVGAVTTSVLVSHVISAAEKCR